MHIIEELKALLAKFEGEAAPVVETVETDAEAIGMAAIGYIKTQGLQELYTIAKAALLGLAAGTPWGAVLAGVVTEGEAAGITIVKGAEAIVLAQAQADLIASGQLAAPVANIAPAEVPVA